MRGEFRIKKFRFRSPFSGLVPLFAMAHFGHHLLTALPVPLLPLIRDEFALDYTQAGWVISAFSLSYGIGQLPAGWLADRIGSRILITVGICGVAVAGLLVGLSQTYAMMMIFFGLMGIMGGGYHPASPPLISASVEPKNRGRALGLHMIGGSSSFFLAPLIGAAIATTWGWRGSFIALAAPTIAFGAVFYVLLGRQMAGKKSGQALTGGHDDAPFTPGRLRHMVSFIVLSTFTQAVLLSVISFIPLFLVDQFGVSRETAAALIAVIYSAGLWASPLGGHLSDRVGRVPVILAVCLLAGPAVYLLNLVPYGLGTGALLLAIGMIIYVRMPVSEAYIVSQTSGRNRSTILGIYYFSSMEGGGLLTPVMGSLIDRLGFHPGFTIAGAAILVVTLICSIWLRDSR
ncbi:MFS transporter, partial [Dehalococcoidia bacterium]|nr:MFS transporter [Dehalococcoidia bacterium]